jgi:Xaa-Pro aminopeptidase
MSKPKIVPMDVASRHKKLLKVLKEKKLDAFVTSNLTNIRYLTGFSGSAAMLAIRKKAPYGLLTTDSRYDIQSRLELEKAGVPFDIHVSNPAGQLEEIAKFLSPAKSAAFEAEHVSWAFLKTLKKYLKPIGLVASSTLVEELRAIKDPGEISRIHMACWIADQAFEVIKEQLKEGLTEFEVAVELKHQMMLFGSYKESFDPIVASGPNAALPHAKPGPRKIKRGELIVFDFGASYDGYASDMTRTISIGEPKKKELLKIYEITLAAQNEGLKAVAPKVSSGAIDGICRNYIEDNGYGANFNHSTGHGIGLEVHELPWVSSRVSTVLQPGHVITVEPGIYLEDVGGVRIEDTLAVGTQGPEILTQSSKEPVI